MLKRLLRRPVVQRLLGSLLSRYLRFALRTTQWTLYGAEHLSPLLRGTPAVVAFWHERLPLMPALWTLARGRAKGVKACVLVSRHADGRFIGEVMRRFDVAVAHGSTYRQGRDRGGAAGMRALLDQLAAGSHVVITPDGPRGPPRVAAPGVAQLAAMAGVRVLPCAAQTTRKRVLRTWDQMVLPLPWGRGVIVCAPPIMVPRGRVEDALPVIAQALTTAAEDTDRLCY
jgi:lysophospholipid acyltransferase (LPLAT)-like uncharacterized protein